MSVPVGERKTGNKSMSVSVGEGKRKLMSLSVCLYLSRSVCVFVCVHRCMCLCQDKAALKLLSHPPMTTSVLECLVLHVSVAMAPVEKHCSSPMAVQNKSMLYCTLFFLPSISWATYYVLKSDVAPSNRDSC